MIHPQDFFSGLFSEMIEVDKVVHVNLLKVLARHSLPGALLLDVSRDGRGRIHLGFYGPSDELATAIDPLLPVFEGKFYLRRRERGFDYEAAAGR